MHDLCVTPAVGKDNSIFFMISVGTDDWSALTDTRRATTGAQSKTIADATDACASTSAAVAVIIVALY